MSQGYLAFGGLLRVIVALVAEFWRVDAADYRNQFGDAEWPRAPAELKLPF